MTQKSFQRVFCLLTYFVGASQPLRPQISSGGTVASPAAVVDFTNAGQTIPARKLATDPATCTVGEQYFNTTSNVLKVCTSTNTWTTSSAPAGASGGIPYYSNASTMASSSTLSTNNVVVGGGAGAAPKATGVTIDASNNVSTSGVVSTGVGGSAHGKLALGELPTNGSTTVGWEAPDTITSSLSLMFPNANPAANSFLGFGVPSAGVSQGSWLSFGPTTTTVGGVVDVNTTAILSRATDQAGTDKICVGAGTATAQTCNLNPALGSLTGIAGAIFQYTPNVNCGIAPTLAINGLSALPLQKLSAGSLVALTTNDCAAGVTYQITAKGSPATAFIVTPQLFDGIALANLATQSNATMVANVSGGSASPSSVALPTTLNALIKTSSVNGAEAESAVTDDGTTVKLGPNFAVTESTGAVGIGPASPVFTSGTAGAEGFAAGTTSTPAANVAILQADANGNEQLSNNGFAFKPLPVVFASSVPTSDTICAHANDASIAGVTCNNTTTDGSTETSFVSAAIIPANYMVQNRMLRFTINSQIWTSVAAPAVAIHVRWGGTANQATPGGTNLYTSAATQAPNDSQTNIGMLSACAITAPAAPGASVNLVSNCAFPLPGWAALHYDNETAQPVGSLATNAQETVIFSVKYALTGLATATCNDAGNKCGLTTLTGTVGQTCTFVTGWNNGGNATASATVTLTGTNAIANGTALVINNTGYGFTAAPTSATGSVGTATACTGSGAFNATLGGAQGNALQISGFTVETLN